MKKVVLAVVVAVFISSMLYAQQTPSLYLPPVAGTSQLGSGPSLQEASTAYTPSVGEIELQDLEHQLWDMGEAWDRGSLLDLITVNPPDTEIQQGLSWRSYGILGIGSRWHQEVHCAVEVKNVLAQNEVFARLIDEGVSLITDSTAYGVEEVEIVDLSDTPGLSSVGIMFKLTGADWQDSWENNVLILPHFDVSGGVYLEVVTIGTHSEEAEAVSLAQEITGNIKSILSELIDTVDSEVSDSWHDTLKAVLFPDKESLSENEISFLESVKQEWIDSGLSEEVIKEKLNQVLILIPFVYKQIFYSPLADSYLYEFDGQSLEDINYRKMLYQGALSLIAEKDGLELDALLLGGAVTRDLGYEKSNDGFVVTYDLTQYISNSAYFPLLGSALAGAESLSFDLMSSAPNRRGKEIIEATEDFQVGFKYIDDNGNEQIILKRFDELAPNIELSGEYQRVDIDLSSFGIEDWSKVTDFVLYFDQNEMSSEIAFLDFKDIEFTYSGGDMTSGGLTKYVIDSTAAKEAVEKSLGRPLILSVLEDRSLLRSFCVARDEYIAQGSSVSAASRRAASSLKESNSPKSLVPFIEEYMFFEDRAFDPQSKEFAFDLGVWSNWLQRIEEEGGNVTSLKTELAIKIFQISHLEEWAAPIGLDSEYLYPDIPFIRDNLTTEEFLETVGMGYLKFFQDTRDTVSGLWFDNSMDIEADDSVISLPGIAGGLMAIPMLVEYGLIDAETGYEWTMQALNQLVGIQQLQKEYEVEFIPFLEQKAEEAGIDLEGLSLAQKMQEMEAIRLDVEVEFLATKGISYMDYLQSKGIEQPSEFEKEKYRTEFLRENSPMFKYGWGGFLYRYWTPEGLPQRKVRDDLINDLSPVDTSYVVYSAVAVAEYFKTYHPELTEDGGESIDTPSSLAQTFYGNIDWSIFLDPYGTMPNLFDMGWLPEDVGDTSPGYLPYNFYEYSTDEGLMVVMLAAMSSTHPVSQDVFNALHRERASYQGGEEFIISPTGTLFTYNTLDLWVDFSDMQYAYPEGDVNWDLNRRTAVLTNWEFSQNMAAAGIETFGPYTWSIDTGYTPKGLRMDYGSGFRIWDIDQTEGGRSSEATEYITQEIGAEAFRGTVEYELGPEVVRYLSQEAINAMVGYDGSMLNSLRALISYRKIMQSYYKMWGEYGTRDSYGEDDDVVRTGGYVPNVWGSYDQMRRLNAFNLLGQMNGKVTPRDLFMNADGVRQGLINMGFEIAATVEPAEISTEPTAAFEASFLQQTGFVTALQSNDFNAAVGELHTILGLGSEVPGIISPESKGDFDLILNAIQTNMVSENRDLAYYLLAETIMAKAVNIAKAACGDEYQQLVDGQNVDVTSAIVSYVLESDSLYNEALSYLNYIDEAAISEESIEMVRSLKFVISKNSFVGIEDVVDAYQAFNQAAGDGLAQLAQEAVYAYDFDGELFGVYSLDELGNDLSVTMKIFEPLMEEFRLEPVLPEETGVSSHFAEQVDGNNLAEIMEEVYIQSILKPYAELVVGRPLDVADSSGDDAGFLAGLAREVEGGLKSGDNTLEEEIAKLEFIARMMVVQDKARGAFHDLAIDERTQDQLDILGEINLWWKGYATGKFNLMKPWQGIPRLQTVTSSRPLAYFATSLSSDQVTTSSEVTYDDSPSLVIDEDSYYLPITLGNWYLPNELAFGLRGAESGSSARIVIRNNKGEEASYRIDDISSNDWTDVEIPLWGPYEVDWMSDEDNAIWKDWLTRELWRDNGDDTYTLKSDSNITMEYDDISDWSNITEVRVVKDTDSDLYLGGIYLSSPGIEAVEDIASYLQGDAQSHFENGKALVVESQDNTTFLVVDVRGNSVQYVQVDPPISPSVAQGFWNFRRGLGLGEYRIQSISIDDFIDLDLKNNLTILDWL